MNSRKTPRTTPAYLGCGGSLFSLGKNQLLPQLTPAGEPPQTLPQTPPHTTLTGAGERDAEAVPFSPAPARQGCDETPAMQKEAKQ